MKPIVPSFLASLTKFRERFAEALPAANDEQHTARKTFDPIAEEIKGLIKQIDLLYKLAARVVDLSAEFHYPSEDGNGDGRKFPDSGRHGDS